MDYHRNSYFKFPQTVWEWNNLAPDIAQVQSLSSFRVNQPSLFLSIHMHYYTLFHFAHTKPCPQSSAYWSSGSIYDEE